MKALAAGERQEGRDVASVRGLERHEEADDDIATLAWRTPTGDEALYLDHILVYYSNSGSYSGSDDAMRISVSEAKGQLTDLVRRAEAGDDIVLTRHGQPTVRLVAVKPVMDVATRRKILESTRSAGMAKAVSGADAARSQDFLYDDAGLPK